MCVPTSASAWLARPERRRVHASAAQVYTHRRCADAAADAGATEICLRSVHSTSGAAGRARSRACRSASSPRGVTLRLRTPTIVRPEDRKSIQKWLDLGLPDPQRTSRARRRAARARADVVGRLRARMSSIAHTAAEIFRLGAQRIVASVELTTDELSQLVAPWDGDGFDVFCMGGPRG